MEDLWKRAKLFADEAAKKSQTLASSATRSSKISDIVSETAKKSKEFALEASKKADQIKISAALKPADLFKSLSDQISSLSVSNSVSAVTVEHSESELRKFGLTDEWREFVKGLTSATFQNFPVRDEEESDVPAISNVRQDLTEWQERHGTLALTTVKEISRLRYELCPRIMKERRFWRIYFTLVNSHVAPYEEQYMKEIKLKAAEQTKEVKPTTVVGETSKPELMEKNLKSNPSSSSAEQDLDTFLLGDFEDSDGGDGAPDDGDKSFDDDFDKIDNSDVEDEKHSKKEASATD